ncbi:MAG: thioredoxin family protein [Gammaproteobacteria bacterium]|nr:thioredoxin family protein [Gammaproteobacteria bacterium]
MAYKKLIKMLLALALGLVLIVFLFFKIQSYLGQQALDTTGIQRYELKQALLLAKQQNKFVLADMSAIWCPTCRKLDREIFSDTNVKQTIAKHYIFSRIEYETEAGKVFMETYKIKGFPSLLILDQDARLLLRLPLTFDPELFIEYLNDFIDMKAS